MVTIGMNYTVIEGKEKTFEEAFNNVLKAMDGMGGHTHSALYRDVNRGQSFLIVSEWNSEELFKTFIGSEEFRKVVTWGKENILAERPTHRVYTQ